MSSTASCITFVTNRQCPFAHRAWLALEFHKQAGGLQYDFKSADLTNKPAWFTEIYSKAIGADPTSNGKVPVIQDTDGTILTESAVIAKYIDDKYAAASGVSLDAGSPLERARVQLFVDAVVGPVLGSFMGVLQATDADTAAEKEAALRDAFSGIGNALLEHDKALSTEQKGPFFLGNKLSFAEVQVWPFVHRVSALQGLKGYKWPEAADSAALQRFFEWKDATTAHPAVAGTVASDDAEYFVRSFEEFLRRVASA